MRDGDGVTVIGYDQAGTLRGLCMRNESTGQIYSKTSVDRYVAGGFFLLLGMPLSFPYGIGIPFLLTGAYLIYLARCIAQANKVLAATPTMGHAPVAGAT